LSGKGAKKDPRWGEEGRDIKNKSKSGSRTHRNQKEIKGLKEKVIKAVHLRMRPNRSRRSREKKKREEGKIEKERARRHLFSSRTHRLLTLRL